MPAGGNFVPMNGLFGPPPPPLPTRCAPGHALSGHGNPEGNATGNPGTRFTDIDTGDMYQKQNGSGVWGWRLVGSVGQAGIIPIG
jgi:hypothetical protein